MTRRTFAGLGKLQAEVMEPAWQRGEATVAQVVEQISQRRPVLYTTVLVAMQKLGALLCAGVMTVRARPKGHGQPNR